MRHLQIEQRQPVAVKNASEPQPCEPHTLSRHERLPSNDLFLHRRSHQSFDLPPLSHVGAIAYSLVDAQLLVTQSAALFGLQELHQLALKLTFSFSLHLPSLLPGAA